MTGDKRLEPAVARAINFCIRGSELVHRRLALPAGRHRRHQPARLANDGTGQRRAGRPGRAAADMDWRRAISAQRPTRQYGGLASYRPDGPASTSMTAEALYCRLLLAESFGTAD